MLGKVYEIFDVVHLERSREHLGLSGLCLDVSGVLVSWLRTFLLLCAVEASWWKDIQLGWVCRLQVRVRLVVSLLLLVLRGHSNMDRVPTHLFLRSFSFCVGIAQLVEQSLSWRYVTGSIPVPHSRLCRFFVLGPVCVISMVAHRVPSFLCEKLQKSARKKRVMETPVNLC